ncbi:hypothetical protein FOIG_01047 [Fusarium odoratissimum NRRL 54006]|nr:uncharacterized protein FOIG_01047 [Fusarium odoratissimum NRRL 54006]EXM11310.1 hypothetical protein FOIG_01047 [Fusarium odoratissimum NRRL 54006]TXC03409.1 hypothetical protein FocTR4_00001109 [Fusarium oxysporum f. sp. cubense]
MAWVERGKCIIRPRQANDREVGDEVLWVKVERTWKGKGKWKAKGGRSLRRKGQSSQLNSVEPAEGMSSNRYLRYTSLNRSPTPPPPLFCTYTPALSSVGWDRVVGTMVSWD